MLTTTHPEKNNLYLLVPVIHVLLTMDRIVPPTPNSYVEVLTPNVLVYGLGDFGRKLWVDEVMRWGLNDELVAL